MSENVQDELDREDTFDGPPFNSDDDLDGWAEMNQRGGERPDGLFDVYWAD